MFLFKGLVRSQSAQFPSWSLAKATGKWYLSCIQVIVFVRTRRRWDKLEVSQNLQPSVSILQMRICRRLKLPLRKYKFSECLRILFWNLVCLVDCGSVWFDLLVCWFVPWLGGLAFNNVLVWLVLVSLSAMLFGFPMCLFLSWLAWLFVNSFLALLGCFLFGLFSFGFYLWFIRFFVVCFWRCFCGLTVCFLVC